jgi:hypothetical protein
MIRRAALLSAAIALLLSPAVSRAWGLTGHAMIADIAEAHLSPAARAQVRALLAEEGLQHLDQVSSWADEIRPLRKEAAPWHYVDIPLTDDHYDAARDCPKGDCVIDAINRYRAILADRTQPAAARLEALKFITHFVGDIQQPLHGTENAGDHGGNKVIVSYFDRVANGDKGQYPLNLHAVWDTVIIEHKLQFREAPLGGDNDPARKIASDYAMKLNSQIGSTEMAAQSLDPIDWAMESHDLAAKVVYPGVVPPGAQPPATAVALGADYERRAWPVVEQRIKQGGLRLAALLNQALK